MRKERETENREGVGRKILIPKCIKIHKCDLLFTMKETMLNAENDEE